MNENLPQRPFRPGMHRFRVLNRYLQRARQGGTWLDLGGGAGEFALLAAKQGFSVTLVDGDPRNIASVADRGVHGVLADLNAPLGQFGAASFDGISLLEVIEHVPQAEQLLAEAFRLLRSGGLLLLSTPNAVWWKGRLRILWGRTPEAEGYHYRFFNVASARRLCQAAGFQVMSMEFSSPAFGLNWVNRRILGHAERRHVRIAAPFAPLLAQTIYVVGRKL